MGHVPEIDSRSTEYLREEKAGLTGAMSGISIQNYADKFARLGVNE